MKMKKDFKAVKTYRKGKVTVFERFLIIVGAANITWCLFNDTSSHFLSLLLRLGKINLNTVR